MRVNYGWVIVAAGALMTCVAFGTYSGLYIGLFAIGLGAAAIALAFPPLQTSKGLAYG